MSINFRARRQVRASCPDRRHSLRNLAPASPNFVLGPGGQASLLAAPVESWLPAPSQVTQHVQPEVSPTQISTQAPIVASNSITAIAQTESQAKPVLSSQEPQTPIPLQPQLSSQSSQQTAQISSLTLPQSSHLLLTNLAISSSTVASSIVTSLVFSSSSHTSSTASEGISSSTPVAIPSSSTQIASFTTLSSAIASSATSTAPLGDPITVSKMSVSGHSAAYYVGIVFGVIAGVALLVAIVAWWIRLRRYKDEAAALHVPWAQHHSDDGLEEARHPSTTALNGTRAGSMLGWDPTGDRDVGEPRADYFLATQPLQSPHPTNGRNDGSVIPAISECVISPNEGLGDYPSAATFGPLQVANLMPGDVASSYDGGSRPSTCIIGTGGGRMLSDFGAPRETIPGLKPRYLGLLGQGLPVPWAPLQPRASTRRNDRSGDWDHLPPLPYPGGSLCAASENQGTGCWTDSLRANLAQAFNAVASNLTISAPTMQDTLTPVPPRLNRTAETKRTPTSRSTLSKAWTLEEIREGAGVVHISRLEPDPYGSLDRNGSHPASHTTLNLASCDGLSTIQSCDSRTSLIPTRKPPSAVTKRRQLSGFFGRNNGPMSRSNSVHSASSTRFGYAPNLQVAMPTFGRKNTLRTRVAKLDSDARSAGGKSRIPRPETITRVSSSGCSAATFRSEVSAATEWTDNGERARAALRERRMDTARKREEEL